MKPKLVSLKLIKPPQTFACTSVVTATTNSTQFLTTTAPLDSVLNKISFSTIQPQTIIHESPSVTVPVTSSMQYTPTTLSSLDSSIVNALLNKAGPSEIQPQIKIHESSSVTIPVTSFMQHTPTIVSSLDSSIIDSDNEKENTSGVNNDGYFIWDYKTIMLFFTEYEQHEKKFQKRKYQSKEAMFQAIAESFQERGYVNATKNHMKNKFKLLKKKWDKHIKQTMGKNSSGKGTKPLPFKE